MTPVLELHLGDVVRLRKVHPCGGYDWQVTRLGADIGLRCLTCNRRILLERPVLEKRIKTFLFHADQALAQDPTAHPKDTLSTLTSASERSESTDDYLPTLTSPSPWTERGTEGERSGADDAARVS